MRSPRSSTGSYRPPRRRTPEMEPFPPDDIFNLADIVLRVAREDPGRIAVIELDGWEGYGTRRYKRHTYAELSADAESVAVGGLREMGIAEMTRIVCMSPPSYETCVVGVALTRVGALSIWIDPRGRLSQRCGTAQPREAGGVPGPRARAPRTDHVRMGGSSRPPEACSHGKPTRSGSPHYHRVSTLPGRAIDQVAAKKTSAR